MANPATFPPVNPTPPEPFVDKNGHLTVAARSLLNALIVDHNLMANFGFTGTATTAKLTGGGVNGTETYTNGVLTTVVAPT